MIRQNNFKKEELFIMIDLMNIIITKNNELEIMRYGMQFIQ